MRRRGILLVLSASLLCGPPLGCSAFKRFAYQGFGRDGWQQPERVVRELELAPGAQVADLGAGGGYFTFRLAEAVGPEGRVFAVDVDEEMTGYLQGRVDDEGVDFSGVSQGHEIVEPLPAEHPGVHVQGPDRLGWPQQRRRRPGDVLLCAAVGRRRRLRRQFIPPVGGRLHGPAGT